MIVQCENCETRFHVADARIPEKGARVRCSRCHHRFHITPSSGTTSSPNSGPDVSARTEESGRPTETAAAAGGGGGGGGDDLENPEFLFEGNSVSQAPARAKGAPASEPEPEPDAAAAPAEPEAPRPPSPDLEPGEAPEALVVATTGKTAQEMLDAGAPKIAKGPKIEFAKSMEDAESDDSRSRFVPSDESPATPREPPPSLRPAKDKPAKPVATLTPVVRPPVPAPKPAAARSDKSEIDAAFAGSLGEDEEAEGGGWESLTQSEESAPKSVFDVGASFGLSGSASEPIAPTESKPVTAFDAQEAGTKRGQAPAVSAFDPEAASPAGTIARAAALLVGIALLAGALRGLELQRSAGAANTEAEQGAGWVATDVETFVARDSLGERVLVVRGNLFPNGAAPPPEVQVSLLGTAGEQIGEPRRAWLERLDDAEIAPDALTVKLASNTGELSGMGPQVTGFTALLADPPAAARRVQVSLAAGKPLPTRGTATATTPAPVTPPANDTRLAAPTAPEAQPSQLPPESVVPASPAPEPD
jgi:predicted Zn finger-like uncharacterized protein